MDGPVVVVAEKASVAKAIRSALSGLGQKILVTNVRGHLLSADLPEGFGWGRVSPLEIMRLRHTRNVVSDRQSYSRLVKLFREGWSLVVATDNDSEGELIGSEILGLYRYVRGADVPYARMRFNSVDRRELARSWSSLEPELRWTWVSKARFRQTFDLITGAAFTRLLTQATRNKTRVRLISWGSCQTPCLNFVVDREKEIEKFQPKPFWYIEAVLARENGETIRARSVNFWDGAEAARLYADVKDVKTAEVLNFSEEVGGSPRPLPARTDEVLIDLTKITRLSASKLLQIMEELYADGYLSYPRTDTNRYWPGFDFRTPLKLLAEAGIAQGDETPRPRNGKLDDGAHPPIYPTGVYRGGEPHKTVWEYAARRFYANAFADDAKISERTAEIGLGAAALKAWGRLVIEEGFYRFFPYFRPRDLPIPVLTVGEWLDVQEIHLEKGETKPPSRLREADLLRAMERSGIGTDATRATYPQLIVERRYARRVAGYFQPTALGKTLIECLTTADTRLVTPETRRMVDELMTAIERGEITEEVGLEKSLTTYEELLRICLGKIEEISGRLAGAVLETMGGRETRVRAVVRRSPEHIKGSRAAERWNRG
ncbi:MAG: DNA topoisomerase [Nitrososphaerota archaeon]